METKVICILALCRSSPLETSSSGDIFKQRAGAVGQRSCSASSKLGCEAKVKSRRRKKDAKERSAVLQVTSATLQVPTKLSDHPSKMLTNKGFEDTSAMSELLQVCPTLDTTTPTESFACTSWIQTERYSVVAGGTDTVDEDLEDFVSSSPWIQQKEEHFTDFARETDQPLHEPIVGKHFNRFSTEGPRSQPWNVSLDADLESLADIPLSMEQREECSSTNRGTQHPSQTAVVPENVENIVRSRHDWQGLSGMELSGSVTARNYFAERCGISTSELSSGWGWHLNSGRHRVVRIRSLFNPMLSHKKPIFRRLCAYRRVHATSSASAEAAQSNASESGFEEDEEYSFTSIAAGDPIEDSMGFSRSRTNPLPGNSRRHLVTDPWFSRTYGASSAHSKDRALTPKSQNVVEEDEEDNSDGVAKKDTINGRQSQASWIKKAQTVVPRKQSKINLSMLQSMQPSSDVDEVMQALEKTASSKGIANVMDSFASKLTLKDLKLLLTELATGPERYWAKAVHVFDWMHDMAVYDIDANMYHSIIVLLGKSKRMDMAETMIQRMKMDGVEPDNYIYTTLVGGYVRSGYVQKGIAVLDQMKADGLRPPVPAYNVLIDGCVKLPRGLEVARSLMKQMKADGVTPDRVTYTTMIIVYSRKGHHGEAIRMFQEMQLQNCYPDVLTYNAVLNAYSKLGDISGMLQVHQSMFDQRVDPDTVTFNIVLNALGRAGRTKDVCRFYRLMRKIGVTPDVTTCSILVNAHGKSRAWDELDSLIAEMESLGLQPDLTVYNSLISIYGKAARFEQVELIVKSLQESNGIMFDVITYNTLIDVYGKAGRLSDVIKWFSEMRRQEVKPDVRTFNALVHAYGRASQYEGVKDVLNLFRADGSRPDLVFYHTLLFMFAKGGKYSDAWGVIEDMQQEGYTLSLDIYNSLILVFGRSNALEALKMYSHMISSKVRPNSITFKVLIEVHARKGMVDECLKIYRKSREFLGDELNDSLLSSVLGACCNMRRMEDAEEILLELEPCLPSVSCFNWLVLGYGRQGLWQNAEEVLERMDAKGMLPNGQSYSFLLEVYSLCGLLEKAEDLRSKMDEHGLLNSVSAYNALLRFHVRSGRVGLALELLDDLLAKGVKVNHNTYTAILSGYGRSDASVNERILAHVKESDKQQLDPKHGVYTAMLAAIPKCKTHQEAYSFLGTLQRLDCPSEICSILKEVVSDDVEEEVIWTNLAKKFHYLDMNGFNLETQRNLQNAVIDALWWLGWEIRALRVVKIGLDLGILGQVFKWSKTEWTLNISGGSVGAVQVLLLMWIASMRKLSKEGEEIPPRVRIILAEDWQLRLKENKAAIEAVLAQLNDLGAVCYRTEDQISLEMSRSELSSWLRQDQLDEKLFLVDSLVKS
ncbi:unnamed protein product [Calypogeia fissa]